jgi:hypothetical protein
MTEIYIDGNLIDTADEEIVLSFGVNNLFSIESTQGFFSNTFKVPATNKNNLIFGLSNNILSISDQPYKLLPCEIYVNGLIQVVGTAQIQSASRYEYEVLVIGGNGNWIDKLKDQSLQSVLAECQYTQYWNETTVVNSRSNTWQDVFIYPNIDYGDLFFAVGSDVTWSQLYPAVYCKYLFRKIFESIGYNISSEWFDNNALFEKQIIPFSARWERYQDPFLRNYLLTEITVTKPFAFAGAEFTFDNNLEVACYDFNVPNRIVILDSATITFKLNLNWTEIANGVYAPPLYKLEIAYTDFLGNPQTYFVFPLSGTTNIGSYSQTFTFTLEVGRGEIIFFNNLIQVDIGTTLEIINYVLNDDSGALQINDTNYNWFELAGTLPDISITDFITTIANQYGLIFQENSNTNTIEIFQFSKIISNLTNPLDWSNKLDLSDEPVITFELDNYAQKNYFQYASDGADEYLTRQRDYGRGEFTINNPSLAYEQVLFETVFSAVWRLFSFNGPSGTGGTIPLAYIPYLEGDNINQVNQRMAYIEFDTSALLTIQPSAFFSNPQPNVYFDELIFANLIPLNYPLFEKILNTTKMVSCLLKLNTLDINNLDFSKPIWVDYFGAFFYLNLIDQYNITREDSTQVQLVLISN